MNKQEIITLIKKYPSIFILVAVFPYLVIKALDGGDFNVYLAAAVKLREQADCYNIWLSYGNSKGASQYSYSPLFATLLIPFTYLPVWLPQLLFLIADVFWISRVLRIIMNLLGITKQGLSKWWLAVVLLFSLRFILHNFEMVQLNIFLLWLSVEGLYQIFFRNQVALGSLLIAAGINFKMLPLVFLPYLAYRIQWKAFIIVIIISVCFLLLPALVFGWDMNQRLHQEWWNIINPMNDKYNAGQNNDSYRIHGLAALFAAYFSKNTQGHFQILIASLDNFTIQWLINGSRLLLVLLTFCFLRTLPSTTAKYQKQFVSEIAYILLITPLLFPQQNKWAFVYLLPAFSVIFYSFLCGNRWKDRKIELALLAIVFILTTLTTDGIIGKNLSYYTECLKLVTIGTLFTIPVLFFSRSLSMTNPNN